MAAANSILVIDYDQPIADLLVEILTEEGYLVYRTLGGSDTLKTIVQLQPALILLDAGSPSMHGRDLINDVRAAAPATTTVVLMSTAAQQIAPLMIGVVECLTKPFDLDELFACVARHLQAGQAVVVAAEPTCNPLPA